MSSVDALRRRRQGLELRLPVVSADQLRSICREDHSGHGYGQLRAKVTAEGIFHARVLGGGRFHTAPYFRGRVRSDGGHGLVARGCVLESRNEVLATYVFVALPLVGWLGVVVLLAAGVVAHPATVIAVIASLVFTLIGIASVRQRLDGGRWTGDVEELTRALSRELDARGQHSQLGGPSRPAASPVSPRWRRRR